MEVEHPTTSSSKHKRTLDDDGPLSPAKTRVKADDDHSDRDSLAVETLKMYPRPLSADEVEPSNREIFNLMQTMLGNQIKGQQHLDDISTRTAHQTDQNDLVEDNLLRTSERIDNETHELNKRIDHLALGQAELQENMRKLQIESASRPAAGTTPTTSSTTANSSRDFVIVIGGFGRDTPAEHVESIGKRILSRSRIWQAHEARARTTVSGGTPSTSSSSGSA